MFDVTKVTTNMILTAREVIRASTDLLELECEDHLQLEDDRVEVGDEDRLGTVLAEVDEGRPSVGLHAGVSYVIHHHE